jgi:subtilisin family serine protease
MNLSAQCSAISAQGCNLLEERSMHTRFHPVIAVLIALALLGASLAQAAPPAQAQQAPIRLKAATFTPTRGEAPNIPPGLMIAGYAQGQRGYYIVQLNGPVVQAWKDQITAEGGEILDYIPDFAFKVRMNPAEARRVERLAGVAWVGLFQPAFKLSPDLVVNGVNLFRVRVERGADAGLATAAVAASGAEVLARENGMLLVGADGAQVDAIAQVLDVAWVENFRFAERHNQIGAGVIMGATTANAAGYDGSTQIVAVADTGIGNGTATGAHPHIPSSRVVAIYNWPGSSDRCWSITDDGTIDVDSGHGTHVAGSVLSAGDAAGFGRGTAPAARLVFQATENWATMKGLCAAYPNGYYLTGIPADLRQLFQQAYDVGARIHANSWGSDANGDYTADSTYADDFIWTRRDMTITFSAGNSGEDANADGIVDNDSIGSPATAKNVITIGASENQWSTAAPNSQFPCDTGLTYRSRDSYQQSGGVGYTCSEMGGYNLIGTGGSRWGFTAPPLSTDATAGNSQQMALFSSRGPTDDGRIKPDVVAPGSMILSGYSSLYQEGYGSTVNPRNNAYQWDGYGLPLTSAYKWMGGTSMSNPLAAGGAAVVRDYYQKVYGLAASAALVKATLINSAVDLLDENNDGVNDNFYPIPNVHEGWGLVNVANATDGSHQFVDQTSGLSTNGSVTYTFSVNSTKPVKISLVWSDAPSSTTAAKNLVNDLDLIVTSPTGAVYRGNVFSGGWTQTGGSADRTNNVENVYVQAAGAGTWTVEVRGFNVPTGPQPYALVADGADSALSTGGGINPTPTATAPTEPTPTATPAPTPTTSPSVVLHVGDLDGTSGRNGNGWRATVTILVHNAAEQPVSGATVSGLWSNSGSTVSCTTGTNGTCSLSTGRINNSVTSVDFTVSNIAASGATYDPTQNHDPDGDSNGTTITVNKP